MTYVGRWMLNTSSINLNQQSKKKKKKLQRILYRRIHASFYQQKFRKL